MTSYALVLQNGSIDKISKSPFLNSVEIADDVTLDYKLIEGEWVAPTAPPKFATAIEAKQAMFDWAQAFTNQITTLVTDNEKHSWGNKNTIALDFLSGNANDFQKLLLDDEREYTGETQEELVAKIAPNAMYLARVASKMSGIRRSTNDELDAVEDPYKYEVILAGAQAKAYAALESLNN